MNPAKSPIEFARTVLAARLTVAQQDVLQALTRERRLAVRACHASGKTYAAAIAALWFAVRYRNSRVLILAPGWLTVRSVIWSEIRSLLAHARVRLPLDVQNQTEIRLDSSLVLGISTNDANRLQGHHAEHVLIIADEAPGIDENFWPAVEGILSGGDSRLMLLGNPTVSSGYFYDAFGRNRSLWTTFSISAFDTPNLVGVTLEQLLAMPDGMLDDDPCPYLVTRRWVKERYTEWYNGSAENSPLWQSRVLGSFPSASSNALIPISWLEHARREAVDNGVESCTIGLDVSGPGSDRTVATAVAGGAILDVGIWTDSDARGPVVQFLKKWSSRLKLVRVDCTGIGWYMLEHLRSEGFRCIGINAGASAEDKERFTNAKSEQLWFLRGRFQRGEVSGLSNECLAELAAINYVIDPKGRTAIEDKASVKSILGRSPDLADSLALALGTADPLPYEYRTPPLDPRQGLGYGHASRGQREPTRCVAHPWRESCVCLAEREDDAPMAVGRLRFGRGAF